MSWAAGTQCVAKGDHRKPKPEELFYHKGDILTIIHTSTVMAALKRAALVQIYHLVFVNVPSFNTSVAPSQKKGFYRVRHNSSGEEGLINSTNVREREALRVDPGLSFMPYVSAKHCFKFHKEC